MSIDYKKALLLLFFFICLNVGLIIFFGDFLYKDQSHQSKKYLISEDFDIAFMGDSRAHRHFDVNFYNNNNKKKLRSINLGNSNINISSIKNFILDNKNLFEDKAVVIVTSSSQFNESNYGHSSIDNSGLFNIIKNENYLNKLNYNYNALFQYYFNSISNYFLYDIFYLNKKLNEKNNGYLPVHRILNSENISEQVRGYKKFWYNDWKIGGNRSKIFLNDLKLIKENTRRLIILIPPLSSEVRKELERNSLLQFEIMFNELIINFSQELDIEVIDLFNDASFTLDKFYDIFHLNNKGSIHLMTKLLESEAF